MRDVLILKTADDEIVLNYLYCFDMDKVVDRITMEQVLELVKTFFPDDYQRLGQGSLNQKQLLEQHRTHIVQKINEYGDMMIWMCLQLLKQVRENIF